jgi:sec-independent protein translocase protein TatC
LAFELPVVVLALVKVGLLDHAQMKATRPYAIVVVFVLAAVITPTPDIFTLLLMGAPMVLLYEACIWIACWMESPAKVEA